MFKGKSRIIAPPHTVCPVGAAADSDRLHPLASGREFSHLSDHYKYQCLNPEITLSFGGIPRSTGTGIIVLLRGF